MKSFSQFNEATFAIVRGKSYWTGTNSKGTPQYSTNELKAKTLTRAEADVEAKKQGAVVAQMTESLPDRASNAGPSGRRPPSRTDRNEDGSLDEPVEEPDANAVAFILSHRGLEIGVDTPMPKVKQAFDKWCSTGNCKGINRKSIWKDVENHWQTGDDELEQYK